MILSFIMFTLGVVVGLVLALLVLVVISRFSPRVVAKMEEIERYSQPKGEIFEPMSDEQVAIDEIIKKNDERGVDTPLDEIQL